MTEKQPQEILEKRLRHVEALLECYKGAAFLHSVRADVSAEDAARVRHLLFSWNKSPISRVGRALRGGWLLVHGQTVNGRSLKGTVQRAQEIVEKDGVKSLCLRVGKRLDSRLRQRLVVKKKPGKNRNTSPENVENILNPYRQAVPSARALGLSPKILIVAELSIPQCAKYRVWQRKEELELLGWEVEVVNWHDPQSALSAMQTSWEVIFYRTPAVSVIKTLIEEAKRFGIEPWWEVDDLIFDLELYGQNSNLLSLSKAEQEGLLEGAQLYRECLQLCGRGIASTRVLGEIMLRAGVRDVCVIENALDGETLRIADQLLSGEKAPRKNDDIVIVYGSGTRTHDQDFLECAEGLAAAMDAEPRLVLRIIGELTLPDDFQRFGARVEYLEGRDYAGYMAVLAGADIAIAPLEPSIFNDAKSNIKFLEAAILQVPVVCSPCDTFRGVVEDNKNGFFAKDKTGWHDTLLALAHDEALRERIGQQARLDVMEHYRPEAIARQQVATQFPSPERDKTDRLRVMAVNIFFKPRSFGGATLVAEEMATHLSALETDVAVFTSYEPIPALFSSSLRYEIEGVPVVGSPLSTHIDPISGLDNPRCTAQFISWVKAFRPDVVHFHSIQGLGLGMLQACLEEGVPFVVTLHDAWWLCERQFMVKPNGRYCFQRHIDLNVCRSCLPGAMHLKVRQDMMLSILKEASLLLAPSESHRALYLANGFDPEQVKVNRNGFSWPKVPHKPHQPKTPIRFGFVGGQEAVKGFPLVREVFEELESADWELVLIDNTLNLGFASMDVSGWKVKGKITIQPAYGDATRDAFFNSIDVLLFPSQWMESYGLTVREALARDVWVISTAPGGQAEDIVDGVNGNLIPLDGRPEPLKTAVEGILARPGMLDSYVNPMKDSLPNFRGQAEELKQYLQSVVQ
ncbi:MAG: glycosyltransferase [Acetobacter sp.]|uniref:glycosyltransferase n=1 Tax=Acetobacter sp. TaxID=440 RepID=UPI0039EC71AF